MPTAGIGQLPKSRSPEEFEDICVDCLCERYNLNAKRYGRSGQRQHGIDIYASLDTVADTYIVAQCKNYFRLSSSRVLNNAILRDLEAASKQKNIKISKFYVMTALDRDVNIQNYIIKIASKYKFDIEVLFWEDIQKIVFTSEKILNKYYSFLGLQQRDMLTLFNLSFFGMQFASLIFSILGDRNETNRYCEIIEQGSQWIRNNNSRIRFLHLVEGVRKFVNGNLPFYLPQQWKLQSEYTWCKDIESIVSMACDSLLKNERLYFLLGAKLAYYNQRLDPTSVPLPTIDTSEKKVFMDMCNTFSFTFEQINYISELFDIMTQSSTVDDLFSFRKLNVPSELYEYIRKCLIYKSN
ncbi:restriction endonuclease [Anaerocolumna aminovalerica]|uniref:restriction endonuclease n=1 Tax=Anaerocolumna aminovalerica TaxID=1527 RepID=UPI001C0ECEF0|nr:restriction endonuclease [Anaerocolumna aminovalerica]MBU5334299.1 restriction endonuclease [Anaerocolumna aminovalerica]